MALLIEYQDIFHSTVRAQPANLQAFHLEVDHSKWHVPANQSRCRRMDRERQTEMDRMINVLQANNIIEPCQDSYYSHAFLVPKSNGKYHRSLRSLILPRGTIKSKSAKNRGITQRS